MSFLFRAFEGVITYNLYGLSYANEKFEPNPEREPFDKIRSIFLVSNLFLRFS